MKHREERAYRRIIASLIYILARQPGGSFNDTVENWIQGIEHYLPQKDVQRIRNVVITFHERKIAYKEENVGKPITKAMMEFEL